MIRDTKIDESPVSIRDAKLGRPPKLTKYKYIDLIGSYKKIVDELANICAISGDLVTPYLTKKILSKNTGVKIGAIKTTAIRLVEKGVLVKYEASKGRNSAWRFTLSKEIFNEYLIIRKGMLMDVL